MGALFGYESGKGITTMHPWASIQYPVLSKLSYVVGIVQVGQTCPDEQAC